MRFIDFIRDRVRYYNCPVCGRSLRGCELRMLRQVEDRFTLQVTCAACQVQFILIVAVQGDGLEPALEEELEIEVASESENYRLEAAGPAREPIQPDELLDVHLLLREWKGSLADLLKQPSGDRR